MGEGQPSEGRGRAARILLALCGCAAAALALLADRLLTGQSGFGLQQWVLLGLGLALLALACGPPRLCRAALALVLASAAALATTEALARLFLTERFAAIYGLDRERLHALIPGATKLFVHRRANEARSVRVAINSRGLRGEELAPKGDRRRWIVYGDSCVQGEFSELEDTFCARLERELGAGFQIVNAGVIAYGPDQVLVRMRAELAPLEVDGVLVCLFADNDFGDLMRNKLFRLDERGTLVAHRFRFDPELLSQLQLARAGLVIERMLRRSLRRLRLERGSTVDQTDRGAEARRLEAWLELCRAEHREYLVEGDPVVRNLFEDHYDADVALDPGSASARDKVALMDALVGEMKGVCQAAGVPLVVVVLPSRLDLCYDLDLGWIDREAWPEYESERLSSTLTTIAERHALPVVDLFGPFRDADPCSLFFRGGDTHWNESGQALGARVVGQALRAKGVLE